MEQLKSASFIYTTGFFMDSSRETIQMICDQAVKLNKPLGFNLSAPFFIDIYIKEMLKTLEYCDYVFCNDDEAAVMAKHLGLDSKDVKGVAKKIAQMPKANKRRQDRIVLITCGKDPTILASSNGKGSVSVKGIPVPKLD